MVVLAAYSDVELWSYVGKDGQSIRQAVDFLLPFATGAKIWPYSYVVTPSLAPSLGQSLTDVRLGKSSTTAGVILLYPCVTPLSR